jgi:flagellar protein FlbT
MHISLRAGDKVYINGAVLRVDRKVSIELLNDATFLLASHVMNVEDATTPLRQLYFVIQIMLMSPSDGDDARVMFKGAVGSTIAASQSAALAAGLRDVERLVDSNRIFEALKAVRTLFPIEAEILASCRSISPTAAA